MRKKYQEIDEIRAMKVKLEADKNQRNFYYPVVLWEIEERREYPPNLSHAHNIPLTLI
jgi:hypothetical protein